MLAMFSPEFSRLSVLSVLLHGILPLYAYGFTSSFTPTASIERQPSWVPTIYPSATAKSQRTRSHRLLALDMPMRPMEDEKEKNSKDDNSKKDSEWKQVVGGFVPKFLKKSNTQDDSKKSYNIITVDKLEDYKSVVVDESDKIVVVRFFAQWCKSCKASAPLYRKLASKYSPEVKFVDAPLTKETAFMHEGLGVPSVPFGHIYHPEVGLVEERKLNKKVFSEFEEAFETYVRGRCELPEEDEGGGEEVSFQ
ncbi:hypothetical protein ACHAXS_005316 [Conticribra weissflogii]